MYFRSSRLQFSKPDLVAMITAYNVAYYFPFLDRRPAALH